MDHTVYVLYSYSSHRYYYGYTANLIQRIYWHNNGNKGFTTRYRPWVVIHVEFFQTKQEALVREQFLKSGNGRMWIKNHFQVEKGLISAQADSRSTPDPAIH